MGGAYLAGPRAVVLTDGVECALIRFSPLLVGREGLGSMVSLPEWRGEVDATMAFNVGLNVLDADEVPAAVRRMAEDPEGYVRCLKAILDLREARSKVGCAAALRILLTKGPEGFWRRLGRYHRMALRRLERDRAVEEATRRVVALEDGVSVPGELRDVFLVKRDGAAYVSHTYRAEHREALYEVLRRGRIEPVPPCLGAVGREELREAVREWSEVLREAAPWVFFVL